MLPQILSVVPGNILGHFLMRRGQYLHCHFLFSGKEKKSELGVGLTPLISVLQRLRQMDLYDLKVYVAWYTY